MATAGLALTPRNWGVRPPVLAAAIAAPAILLLAQLLPQEGLGLAVRLAAAVVCLLVLPGALIVRAIGWPAVPAYALAASIAVSLGVLFVALAITFVVEGSLDLTVGLVGVAALAALLPAARADAPAAERSEAIVFAAVLGAGVVFAGVVWWVQHSLGTGDVLFHLGRARKLAEADSLSSLSVVNEFRDGGDHPGYAFPLWHAFLAAVSRLAGVDASLVVLHAGSALTPLAFGAAYAAGRAVLGHWAGGVAALAAQVAWVGFSRAGVGSFTSLALPATATRLLLVSILLALVFAYLREPSRRLLPWIAAAALAVGIVHPSYLVLVAIPLAGFAALAIAVGPRRRDLAVGIGWASGAVLVPAAVFFAWLWPSVSDFASHRTAEEERARALAHYGAQLQGVGDGLRAAPDAVTRTGPVLLAALIVLPLVALAVRRWWASLAVGGTVLTLGVLLVPFVFTAFVDAISVSQGRRLAQFLPVAFAIAAAAVFAGRFRIVGAAAALGLGVALELAYQSDSTPGVEAPGPVWPLWVALVGAPAGIAVGLWLGSRLDGFLAQTRWTAVAACAFVAPIAVAGLADLHRADAPDSYGLSPGLVRALGGLDDEAVVFAPVETAYRVTAAAPVFVAATLPFHVADTGETRPHRRQRDAIRFFNPNQLSDSERMALLERYGADYVLVDKTRPYPKGFAATLEPVYEDGRYLLVRVPTTDTG
jgi:hypothetical protein